MDAGRRAHLDPSESLRLLGLPAAASAAEIKRAYRRLAQRFHPDKTEGDEAARKHFIAICSAYRLLMRTARLVAQDMPVGTCFMCREFGEVVVGLDGRTRCPDCSLRASGRRFLPLPTFVVVKCGMAFAMLGLCAYLLLRAMQTGRMGYAAAGMAAGLGVLGVLAATCLRVVYCAEPHHESSTQGCRRGKRRRVFREAGSVVFLGLGAAFIVSGLCCAGTGLLQASNAIMDTGDAALPESQPWLPLVMLSLAIPAGGLGIWFLQIGRSLEKPYRR